MMRIKSRTSLLNGLLILFCLNLSSDLYAGGEVFQGRDAHQDKLLRSPHSPGSSELDVWINSETNRSLQGLFLNISPPGTARGSVTASPSRQDPDYYFHWVRDASLVMGAITSLYETSPEKMDRSLFASLIDDFSDFTRRNQITPNFSGGLGEPKFNVDGSAFMGEWGRPQNDGPALRAITLTHYAKLLLAEGKRDAFVRSKLYDSQVPTQSIIKADLEFVSHHWSEGCFDLWEDTKGQHFYARMVQRRSLLDGAELADTLGDFGASVWYRGQAKALESEILKHWDAARGYLVETLNWSGGNSNKASGLDVAIILGVLHGSVGDGFLSPGSDLVVATADQIRESFQKLYDVNRIAGLGTAIGRYPEDIYDGQVSGDHLGNPWVLATLGFAELYFRIADEWRHQGRVQVNGTNLSFIQSVWVDSKVRVGMVFDRNTPDFDQLIGKLKEQGDLFLMRVKYHSPANGSLSEQMNRTSGYMQGARDLAWNYASFLTAVAARVKLSLED